MFRTAKKHFCLGIILLITAFLAKKLYFECSFETVAIIKVAIYSNPEKKKKLSF